jgi:radical SAM-linked protein
MNIFPYRLRYTKTGRYRFLSHHDLIRLWEHALRRTGLPLRFTQGFHPRPILSFASALPLGVESLDEVLQFELSAWVAPRAVRDAVAAQLPPGMEVRSVEPGLREDRWSVAWVEYEARRVRLPEDFAQRSAALFARESIPIQRPRDWGIQHVDIRPFVMNIEAIEGGIRMRIRVTDSGTARPEEVLRALDIPVEDSVRFVKTRTELAVERPARPSGPPRRRRRR